MPRTTLAHYRLESQIGSGGMADVFRALDTKLNRPVAIKVIRAQGTGRSAYVQRFFREARAASALNHPNIVVIHAIGRTQDGDRYIVQEFVDGHTLRAMLDEPLPVGTIVDIGSQIARALAAAHAAGIVHRDVKPENIMVRDDGYVKVLDFGLARPPDLMIDEPEATMYTAPGIVFGTPSYLSPERASGQAAGTPSDIFALGIVLYEMAAGRRPFIAPTMLGVIASIVSEPAMPLVHVNPAVPPALDDLIQRMLAKDPARRPTAREVEQELAAPKGTDASSVRPQSIATSRRATVGREAEREQLRRSYAKVLEGRGLVITVTGEPGIGKTTLIKDFLAELASLREPPLVVRGRCSERLAGAEAYLPVLDALDSLLHRGTGSSIETMVRTIAPTWYVQVATRTLVETAIAELREEQPVSQERMKRELGSLVYELSRMRPLVVFIDDLHWADVSTIDVINYLAGRGTGARVLVLASYRASDMALAQHAFIGVRSELQARGVIDEIDLKFLTQADVERYLALQFPGHVFPDDFASAIYARTEGSPLFMVDLVRYLRDTGTIVEEGGTWALGGSLPTRPQDLPQSVRAMITRKIDQVDEDDRRLLVAAAVQGPEFDSATVADALEMDPADVEERLELLERVHGFVTRRDEREFTDRTLTVGYQFVHVLYQNVFFASLQPTRRAALAGRVGRSLVAHHGADTGAIASDLAVLFETAREFAVSAQYFLAAAQRAVALLAFREALSLAERGLQGLRGVPEDEVRQKLELGLQLVRGRALRSVKGWADPELQHAFDRAGQLCHALNDPPQLFPALWSIGVFHLIRGNLRECRDISDDLMKQAERAGTPSFLMAAHHIGGVCREFIGDLVESTRMLERSRELHAPAEHLAYSAVYGLDPGMLARAMSSRPLWTLGYPDRADARARETLAIARPQRQPMTLGFALVIAQGIHLHRGEADEALSMGDEIIALCREYEQPQEVEWSRCIQGGALAALGRTDEAIALLKDSLEVQRSIRTGLVRPAFLALLAAALGQAGRVDEGLQAVDEGFAHAERTIERGSQAELYRVRGELLRKKGNLSWAEQSLREAIDYARAQQAKSFELRSATGLAWLLSAAGRHAEAHEALAPVYGWFSEGHDTADLRAARAVLATLV